MRNELETTPMRGELSNVYANAQYEKIPTQEIAMLFCTTYTHV